MIAEYYKDCEILLTGGSGVVGKSAIEKLLRSCDVKRIYILLRGKRNSSVEQRLEELKNTKIFRVLKTQKPDELNKLVAIPGDAVLPQLGISPEYAKILENVSVFFHCAATVRFNESLKAALQLNVGGTYEALKFALKLKKLKLFMHVSTFFSNPYVTYVEPKIYPSPMDWKFCLDMVQDPKREVMLDAFTKKITMGFANTYCFTKNLAESAVNSFRDRLPVAIYRPSIVLFAVREPESGYPPALMGAMALFVLVGGGILKTVYMKEDIRLDVTPLDIGTIVMLASGVLADKQFKKQTAEVPVYLCSSVGVSPHTFKEMGNCPQDHKIWDRYVFDKNFLIPGCYFTSCKYFYTLLTFTHQAIPAMLLDGLLKLFGQKPVVTSIVRKAISSLQVMQPFLFNNYDSPGITNLKEIRELTDNTDFSMEESFHLGTDDAGLHYLVVNMVKKIREVLLSEDEATQERARKVLMVKKFIYNVVRAVLAYKFILWFYKVFLEYVNKV